MEPGLEPGIVERDGKRFAAFPKRSGLGRWLVEIKPSASADCEVDRSVASAASADPTENDADSRTAITHNREDGTEVRVPLPRVDE